MIVGLTARHVVCADSLGPSLSEELGSLGYMSEIGDARSQPRYGIFLQNRPAHVKRLKQAIAHIQHGVLQAKRLANPFATNAHVKWQYTLERLNRQLQVVENLVDDEIGELVYAPPRSTILVSGDYCDMAVFKFHEPLHPLLRTHGGLLDTRQLSHGTVCSLSRQHEIAMNRIPDHIDHLLANFRPLIPITDFGDNCTKGHSPVLMCGSSSGLHLGAIELTGGRAVQIISNVPGMVTSVCLIPCPPFGQWWMDENPDKWKFFAKEGDSGASVITSNSTFQGMIVGGLTGGSQTAFMMTPAAIAQCMSMGPGFEHCPPAQRTGRSHGPGLRSSLSRQRFIGFCAFRHDDGHEYLWWIRVKSPNQAANEAPQTVVPQIEKGIGAVRSIASNEPT